MACPAHQSPAVVIYGDPRQFVEIGGKHYSRIIDPKNGLGITEALTVLVVAPTAAESDARATPASVSDSC